MEGNRKSYSDDSQAVIKKQRVAIEQVKDENASLRHVSLPPTMLYDANESLFGLPRIRRGQGDHQMKLGSQCKKLLLTHLTKHAFEIAIGERDSASQTSSLRIDLSTLLGCCKKQSERLFFPLPLMTWTKSSLN